MSSHHSSSHEESVDRIEYEMMLLTRLISGLPGHSGRRGGQLDHSAYVLMSFLKVGGPMTIRELSEITGLDASTLNRQTAALVKHAHAARIPDPDGAIARRFALTDEGAKALHEEREASTEALASLLEGWTESEKNQFAASVHRFNTTVESRAGRPQPRPGTE